MAVATYSLCSPPYSFGWRPPAAPPLSMARDALPIPTSLSAADRTLERIGDAGVIACLRANSPELAMGAASAALRAGISVLEIVVSTPDVFEILSQLGRDYPAAILGVGTVLTSKDARNAVSVGARFLMSPAIVWEILSDIRGSDVLYIPGVMTPTEILTAYDAGAKIVKVYPVSALGGISYISAIQRPFTHIPMVASQGVTLESTGEYIARGASAVVLSDAIFNKEAMSRQDFDMIYQLALKASLLGNEAVELRKSRHLHS